MTRPRPRPSWTIWAAASLVLWLTVPAQAAEPWLSFAGQMARGATYRQQLDGDLWLELRPDPQGWGWHIWLGDPARPTADFAAVVTPPYHGINQTQLYGWHFRNADNSGPNGPGPNNVNAPQQLRSFSFVLTSPDYDSAAAALDRLLWGPDEGEDVRAHLTTWRRELAKGQGVLEITEMTLGNLEPGEMARFEQIAFTLRLWR